MNKAKHCFSSAEESYNTVPCVAIHGLFAAKVCSNSTAHAEDWTQIEPADLSLNQYYFFKKHHCHDRLFLVNNVHNYFEVRLAWYS